eukprot:6489471-Amphidinium_carterae.1
MAQSPCCSCPTILSMGDMGTQCMPSTALRREQKPSRCVSWRTGSRVVALAVGRLWRGGLLNPPAY